MWHENGKGAREPPERVTQNYIAWWVYPIPGLWHNLTLGDCLLWIYVTLRAYIHGGIIALECLPRNCPATSREREKDKYMSHSTDMRMRRYRAGEKHILRAREVCPLSRTSSHMSFSLARNRRMRITVEWDIYFSRSHMSFSLAPCCGQFQTFNETSIVYALRCHTSSMMLWTFAVQLWLLY